MTEVILSYDGTGEDKHNYKRVGELVRCGDCKYWTEQENHLQGRCSRYKFFPHDEWFCAGGRRRDT